MAAGVMRWLRDAAAIGTLSVATCACISTRDESAEPIAPIGPSSPQSLEVEQMRLAIETLQLPSSPDPGTPLPKLPQPEAASDPPRPAPSLSDAAVVAGMRAGFRTCYRKYGADRRGGEVKLILRVAENGAVTTVEHGESELRDDLVACLVEHAASARFARSERGDTLVEIPLTF